MIRHEAEKHVLNVDMALFSGVLEVSIQLIYIEVQERKKTWRYKQIS